MLEKFIFFWNLGFFVKFAEYFEFYFILVFFNIFNLGLWKNTNMKDLNFICAAGSLLIYFLILINKDNKI